MIIEINLVSIVNFDASQLHAKKSHQYMKYNEHGAKLTALIHACIRTLAQSRNKGTIAAILQFQLNVKLHYFNNSVILPDATCQCHIAIVWQVKFAAQGRFAAIHTDTVKPVASRAALHRVGWM